MTKTKKNYSKQPKLSTDVKKEKQEIEDVKV